MNILLTGSTGFVGRAISNKYDIYRHVVRGENLCNHESTFVVETIDGDTEWPSDAFNNVDAIIHLAGLAHSACSSTDDYNNINYKGTLKLAMDAASAGVKRFVFVSSIGVNGLSTDNVPFSALSKVRPHNDYARSKYLAELGLMDVSKKTGLEVVIVRPTLVYGLNAPGNFGRLLNIIKKISFLPFGLAENKRSFISVQNLADLLVVCASHENAAGHIFLASDCEAISIKEFTNAIAEGLGKQVYQLPIPVTLVKIVGDLVGKRAAVEQLFGNLEVDSSNTLDILGWRPPLTMKQSMSLLRNVKG
ncbi:NAD-dependent epimerase/dehydratase family protein [Plesiomonas shigelloides]|uniref:UDP-glucose 4-epimerase n=1 Tax=Plesiomonas shigelloides TaxID=703 RepID=A0A4D6U797_PLESH|nr:NAD-dependent epimerase/dehydratase family protein [Plesiomonas shigelloides]KAB7698582.1 NAD-dependent epimerase/dehydratase family protein [Plesiomonas shigelloides]QCH03121.1 UDP-glucose 4-epimerase [Plesiomonas shigelloides]